MAICNDCGGTVIEYDAAAGNGFCVRCGTVVEENTIVSEVTFGETSSGAAMVQGSYVAQGSTHARMSGPFGNRGSNDSREQTIANANRKIQSIATILRLSEVVSLAATRLYTLAVEHKFTKGRKGVNVVAVCLYVACRQKETKNYMLIDFSDLLQVNVFELGHTYLQLVQTLNLRLPLVDPSHYISRFSALLEFGDETHKVAHDAVRLVQRFDRDWMTKGRRPAGICGAALLLAARMNNFRRSVEEVVQVVKIADSTLKKRLEEFARTSSAGLTVGDFRRVWLEEEMDPPAFSKGKEKERDDEDDRGDYVEDQDDESAIRGKKKRKGQANKRKRNQRGEEDEDRDEWEAGRDGPSQAAPASSSRPRPAIDPALLYEGILAGTMGPPPNHIADPSNMNIDPSLLPPPQPPPSQASERLNAPTALDETAHTILTEEVSRFLSHSQGAQLSEALAEVEARRQVSVVDELMGLDEEELDRLLLSEEEVRVKERVWVEMNKEYLEALAAKAEREESGVQPVKSKKRRKASTKPRDASTAHGSTAAESVRKLLKKNPKYSKRINYDALKELFVEGSFTAPELEEKKMDKGEMYTMDQDQDGPEEEMVVVVEEDGGAVGTPAQGKNEPLYLDEDAEGEDDLEGDVDTGGWDDTYEQEV